MHRYIKQHPFAHSKFACCFSDKREPVSLGFPQVTSPASNYRGQGLKSYMSTPMPWNSSVRHICTHHRCKSGPACGQKGYMEAPHSLADMLRMSGQFSACGLLLHTRRTLPTLEPRSFIATRAPPPPHFATCSRQKHTTHSATGLLS